MQPVLILTETEKITQHKAYLTKMLVPLQAFYNLFKAINVDATVADMHQMAHQNISTQIKSQMDEFVGNKMMDKAGTPDFGGVPIKREKLRDMLDMPDTTDLIKQAQAVQLLSQSNGGNYWLEPKYYQIVNDVVSIKADAFANIEDRYTHYTKNNRGDLLATKMNEFIPQLNDYITLIGRGQSLNFMRELGLEKIGIEWTSVELRPSLYFIRNEEKNFPG